MNHKKATIILIIAATALHAVMFLLSQTKNDNYLYIGQWELSSHFFFVDQTTRPKIIFVGSSAVAGNNIPERSTLTDYFNAHNNNYQAYNLAALQANLLDATFILHLAKNKNPKISVLGIDPSIMKENQFSPFSRKYSDSPPDNLPPYYKTRLNSTLKDKLEVWFHFEPSPPLQLQVRWKSFLSRMRNDFWGPLFNKQLHATDQHRLKFINKDSNPAWELVDTYIATSQKNNIIPVILIEPVLAKSYVSEEFELFVGTVQKKADSRGAIFLDYSNLLPPDHMHFQDFVHLTPLGYNLLANKLSADLVERKIISKGGP